MKLNRFLSLLAVLLVLDISGLRADAVTPEQAKQIASQFFSNKGPRRMQSSARRTSAQSAMTTVAVFDSIDSAGQPYIYAVSASQQDGFVLVSGDDRFNAVLGYSDGSSYDEQTMPENMRAWMQGYIAEMRYLESKGYRSAPLRSASPSEADSRKRATNNRSFFHNFTNKFAYIKKKQYLCAAKVDIIGAVPCPGRKTWAKQRSVSVDRITY